MVIQEKKNHQSITFNIPKHPSKNSPKPYSNLESHQKHMMYDISPALPIEHKIPIQPAPHPFSPRTGKECMLQGASLSISTPKAQGYSDPSRPNPRPLKQ
jgi:hypothetical protein